jgi:1-aminocyclopropane-1-carboxylate deaminase/D-cysteine desulfhydrase-like pyridoxal-dependent ACC family enzyme
MRAARGRDNRDYRCGMPPARTLGTWPTPMEPAPRLGVRLGLGPDDLWIKRDDLGGLGGGGNKVRKLEFTCADALGQGATVLVTSGAAQSNHARLTAAAAARLGLGCVLVLAGETPDVQQGNLVLDRLAAASLIWAGEVTPAGLSERVEAAAGRARAQGQIPYVVPFGGSSSLAAQGYVMAAREILVQLPDVENVVVAVGSGGTMAGLVACLGAGRVFGVDTGAVTDAAGRVSSLIEGMAGARVRPDELRIDRDQVAEGYDTLAPGARRAMAMAAQTEGIFLDPTYTARALAGLASSVQSGAIVAGQRTVFVHTGGLPGLFGHRQLQELLP